MSRGGCDREDWAPELRHFAVAAEAFIAGAVAPLRFAVRAAGRGSRTDGRWGSARTSSRRRGSLTCC
jgi:hypothetical protein